MNLPFHIAIRYLFAKKSHNVINIISLISAIGIALGCGALIIILSVYNGFDNSIKEILESYKADYVISPSKGKTLDITQPWYKEILDMESIAGVYPIVEEDVFVNYSNTQSIAHARGVEQEYLKEIKIEKNCINNNPNLYHGEIPQAVLEENLAYKLGARITLNTPIELYYPDKNSQIHLSNPTASLNYSKLFLADIYKNVSLENQDIIYVPLEILQHLTGYSPHEFTKIELYKDSTFNLDADDKALRAIIPENIVIKDKAQQDQTLNRIIQAEKIIVYLILFFVILIISINIFSCLAMLILDKEEDIATFLSLGATEKTIKRIFYFHGIFICMCGTLAGIIIGVVVSLIQQHFKVISMPGNYIIESYPVDLQISDIIITFTGVAIISVLVSYLPAAKFLKK